MAEREDRLRARFLEGEFGKYYSQAFDKTSLTIPLEGREWAFFYIDRPGVMQRHLDFKAFNELKEHITSNVPLHVYSSSALYKYPGAPTMEGKEWLGADLVFDLDADHIPGAEGLSYKEMLEAIKVQFIDLIEDFLMGDFGFVGQCRCRAL